ncbi:MAG: polyphosphate polymerase domain-containing protein [Opitutaceae bacterium]
MLAEVEANQNRREFKFVLTAEQSDQVRARVAEEMHVDRDNTDGYQVTSEYFDTGDRHSYWEKQFGVSNRRRIRSRIYGQADDERPQSAFLEVKHKLNGETVKRRLLLDIESVDAASCGELPTVTENRDLIVQREIADMFAHTPHEPVVQIRYHRYAYDSGMDGLLRVTFDVDPCCRFTEASLLSESPEFDLELLERGASIMEVKVAERVPYWFRQLLGEFKLVPRGYSKYATALERYEFPWSAMNQLKSASA